MMNTTQRKALPFGYRWECVFDPNGLFEGRFFMFRDLQKPWESGWAEGTTFQNIEKPETKVVKLKRGNLVLETVPSSTDSQ